MSVFPQLIYGFNTILIHPSRFLIAIHKLILKFIWHFKGSRIAQPTLKKKSKVVRQTLRTFHMYFKAIAIDTVWYLCRIDEQINGTEQEFRNRPIHGQLISNRDIKIIPQGEGINGAEMTLSGK